MLWLSSDAAISCSCFLSKAATCCFASIFTEFVIDTIIKSGLVIKSAMVRLLSNPYRLQAGSG